MRAITKSIERRGKTRFAMQRELRYKLLDGETMVDSGAGKTLNMSSAGVGFLVDRTLPAGAFIELSISWPVELEGGWPLRLVVFGQVKRSGISKSACSIEKYEFRTQARELRLAAAPRVDGTLRRWTREFAKAQRTA